MSDGVSSVCFFSFSNAHFLVLQQLLGRTPRIKMFSWKKLLSLYVFACVCVLSGAVSFGSLTNCWIGCSLFSCGAPPLMWWLRERLQ